MENSGDKFSGGKLEIKREIPTGKGRELSGVLRENPFLFENIDNKVVFVNPGFSNPEKKFNLPFKLQEGEKSPLALFVKAALYSTLEGKIRRTNLGQFAEKVGILKEKEIGNKARVKILNGRPLHHRSIDAGMVIFRDNEGRIYRDINLKGIGFMWGNKIKEPGVYSKFSYRDRGGILFNSRARDDYESNEELLSEGVRTYRTLGIIELEEIIAKGKKISLGEAVEKGIISSYHADFDKPVIQVRAFGTSARIDDVVGYGFGKKTKDILLDDAKKLVSQETGMDLSSNEDYLGWFAETHGKNVGLMHINGRAHNFLTGHNTTLDCRIVDTHTVNLVDSNLEKGVEPRLKRREIYEIKEDVKRAKFSLKEFVSGLGYKNEIDKYLNKFQESYDSVFAMQQDKLSDQ